MAPWPIRAHRPAPYTRDMRGKVVACRQAKFDRKMSLVVAFWLPNRCERSSLEVYPPKNVAAHPSRVLPQHRGGTGGLSPVPNAMIWPGHVAAGVMELGLGQVWALGLCRVPSSNMRKGYPSRLPENLVHRFTFTRNGSENVGVEFWCQLVG